MFDLEAYLERIGLGPQPSFTELHRAHVASIPFENLDPHRGVPVSLELEDLQRKLVAERRGGYCFEQNLLLKAALEAIGAEVDLMLARVRRNAPPGTIRPLTHLVLRVRMEGSCWHADVGFGTGTLLEPLPFGPGGVYEQSGWRFQVVQEGEELVLQGASARGADVDGAEWRDLYGFVPVAVPQIDVEVGNWFTCSHPRSPFVTGFLVSTQHGDGTRVSLSDWDGLALTEETPARRAATPVERGAIPRLLAERFGLDGFMLDGEGSIVRGEGSIVRDGVAGAAGDG